MNSKFPASFAVCALVAAVLSCSKSNPSSDSRNPTIREASPAGADSEEIVPKSRTLRFTYETAVTDYPAGSKELRLWIPAPQNAPPLQIVTRKALEGGVDSNAEISEHSSPNGVNSWWHVRVPEPSGPIKFTATMTVTRREIINNYFRGAGAAPLSDADRERFKEELAPYELVPVGGRITGLASAIAPREKNLVTVARRIYDYVLENMKYSKDGTGWGRGDALWACDSGFGNCTDFHSLFMSIAKEKGIPARFHMGFPIPDKRGAGSVGGYHCWAEFFIADLGWVPVDISEADKNPDLAQYYFGSLTEDRLGFMTGRDLTIEPPPAAGKRNLFIYPYAEADGKEVKAEKAFSYEDV